MPKVAASLSNVSTEFVPIEPDFYHCTLTKPDFNEKNGRTTIVMEAKVVSGEDTSIENAGRVIRDRISMHKKDGEPNEFGSIQLKRYVEAAMPESSDWSDEQWDEFDTDQLAGREVALAVIIEEYDEELPGGRTEQRKTNRIKRILAVA